MSIKVGVIGCFQNGKSTFINCLLGTKLAPTGGDGLSVTSANTVYCYSSQNELLSINGKNNHKIRLSDFTNGYVHNVKEICIGSNASILQHITIIDTPGFNANSRDTRIALESFKCFDIAIIVVNNKGLSSIEIDILKELQARSIPYYVVMNCLMQQAQSTWNPNSEFNQALVQEAIAKMTNNNLTPMQIFGHQIIIVNSLWYWYSITQFRYESKEKLTKQEKLLNSYREEFPQTDFFDESNMSCFTTFFSSSLNLLPLKVYDLMRKNVNKSIGNIMNKLTIYPHSLRQITIKEIEKQQHEIEQSPQLIKEAENELTQVRNSTTEFWVGGENSFGGLMRKWLNNGGSFYQMLIEREVKLHALHNRCSQINGEKEKLEIELHSISAYIKLLSNMLNYKNN